MMTETLENAIPNERRRGIFGAFSDRCPPMRHPLLRFAPDRFTMLLVATVVLATVRRRLRVRNAAQIATDVAIAFMFFLYGARLATSTVIAGVGHWRLHALVLASTFVLFPIIGMALLSLSAAWLMPGPLALGMLFLCVLPSTIQSSLAFTSIAGGNVSAAMCSATLSSLVGTVLTPLLVAILASAHGAAPTGDAIEEICLLLLFRSSPARSAPLDRRLRRASQGDAGRDRSRLDPARRLRRLRPCGQRRHLACAAAAGLRLDAGLEALVLGIALVATRFAAETLGFDRADTIAIVFCGSKKSLAAGVPMAGVLFPAPTSA